MRGSGRAASSGAKSAHVALENGSGLLRARSVDGVAAGPLPRTHQRRGAARRLEERQLSAVAFAGAGAALGAGAAAEADHAYGLVEWDAGHAAVALEGGTERE